MNTFVHHNLNQSPVVILDFNDLFDVIRLVDPSASNDMRYNLEFCLQERLRVSTSDAMIALILPKSLGELMFVEDIDTYLNHGVSVIEGEHEDFIDNAKVLVAELNYHADADPTSF